MEFLSFTSHPDPPRRWVHTKHKPRKRWSRELWFNVRMSCNVTVHLLSLRSSPSSTVALKTPANHSSPPTGSLSCPWTPTSGSAGCTCIALPSFWSMTCESVRLDWPSGSLQGHVPLTQTDIKTTAKMDSEGFVCEICPINLQESHIAFIQMKD